MRNTDVIFHGYGRVLVIQPLKLDMVYEPNEKENITLTFDWYKHYTEPKAPATKLIETSLTVNLPFRINDALLTVLNAIRDKQLLIVHIVDNAIESVHEFRP